MKTREVVLVASERLDGTTYEYRVVPHENPGMCTYEFRLAHLTSQSPWESALMGVVDGPPENAVRQFIRRVKNDGRRSFDGFDRLSDFGYFLGRFFSNFFSCFESFGV